MAIEYSCFISYRHGQFEATRSFIDEFYLALCGELELLLDQQVYMDRERLKGGNFYNEALAEALCQSACMIMIFTPRYFSKEHSYCAREYQAMVSLEKERLELLGLSHGRKEGLIIPVVLRAANRLPEEIKDQRLYHDFSRFVLSDRRMSRNPKYTPQIKEIAGYVAERCESLRAVSDQLTTDCQEFSFPTLDDISDWLNQLTDTPPLAFPGRVE